MSWRAESKLFAAASRHVSFVPVHYPQDLLESDCIKVTAEHAQQFCASRVRVDWQRLGTTMLPLLYCCCLFPAVLAGDKASGISQFWADDIKVFDQIYGRTSDRELYGATLPPTITYNFDITKPIQLQASDKKEWYLSKDKLLDPYLYNDFDDKNAKLLSNYLYTKKTKPALQFISFTDLKKITEANDPDTYNYLKNLEQMTKRKNEIQKINKLKSHDPDAEANEAYKSIQEILDAHEANKKESSESNADTPKTKKGNHVDDLRHTRRRNRNKVRQINGNSLKSRDASTRFRKSPPALRVATRPYVRKIRYHYTK